MSGKATAALEDVHPKMLRVDGEGDRKKVAVAKSVERALEILGMSKQAAAFEMGYQDQGTVSRWCSGLECPHFDKLLGLAGFDEAWMKARSERNPRVRVRTVIEIQEQSA